MGRFPSTHLSEASLNRRVFRSDKNNLMAERQPEWQVSVNDVLSAAVRVDDAQDFHSICDLLISQDSAPLNGPQQWRVFALTAMPSRRIKWGLPCTHSMRLPMSPGM